MHFDDTEDALTDRGAKNPMDAQIQIDDTHKQVQLVDPLEAQKAAVQATVGFRRLVANFTPSWFSVNMGTGIVSILLHNCPYQFSGLSYIATIFYVLNILIFLFFLSITVLRYIWYPFIFKLMLFHPAQSLFVGTFPMGLATIINATVLICVPVWGRNFALLAWLLWWIDSALSVLSCIALPYIMIQYHRHTNETLLATWLLPIVPCVVAAASGGLVATVLEPNEALVTIMVAYFMWALGIALSFLLFATYLYRLILFNLPPNTAIVSLFLPLGPLGQGAFGLMQLGTVGRTLYPKLDFVSPQFGEVVYCISTIVGFLMWAFGTWWLILALISIFHRLRQHIPFNIGFWAFIFPLGVYTTASISLSKIMDSEFFRVFATIKIIILVVLWGFVGVKTFTGAVYRQMIVAPCLLPKK